MIKQSSLKKFAGLFASSAFAFVFIMGIVNFFSDMTYEGASSINGPFLKTLGASAAIIGIISGVGEFLGYSMRYVSGYISDKTGKYWIVTFVGYIINLLAVPALALSGNLPMAAGLVIAERVGRAIRKPSVEAMLSYTTNELGKGWVYGLNTSLDQLGATVGPLLIALVLVIKGDFRTAYGLLLISAVLAIGTLTIARMAFPQPTRLEEKSAAKQKKFISTYWLYMLAGAFVAAGLISFELISYHFSKAGTVSQHWIPIFFALAMGTDAIASLIFGRLFDRLGIWIVLIAFFLSAFFAPLVFFGNFMIALGGMILWGIGLGAQDTLLKALIAEVMPEGKRNQAFGLFYIGYGLGWLIGSIATGFIYERSLPIMVAFSVVAQLIALPIFYIAQKKLQ